MGVFPKRVLISVLLPAFGAMLSACGGSSTLTVNSADNAYDGACNATHCSLREAIILANGMGGSAVIHFHIGGGGLQTIHLDSNLPAVMAPMIIDATSQPGYANVPLIVLDGSGTVSDYTDGFLLVGGGTTIKGFVIQNFNGRGIHIDDPGGNVIVGNYIGTDAAGAAAAPNGYGGNFGGIWIQGGDSNRIGGTGANERNVISGNAGDGIRIDSADNRVVNNHLGTNAAGTAALPNTGNGLTVSGPDNRIGGTDAPERNVVSANARSGIELESLSSRAIIYNNYIGTNAAGSAALGNGRSGILVDGADHRIGSADDGSRNVISGNGETGMEIRAAASGIEVKNNFIGTDASGMHALGNAVGVVADSGPGVVRAKIGGGIIAPNQGNVISGNVREGMVLYDRVGVWGNKIGTDAAGLGPLPNGENGILVKGSKNQIGSVNSANTIAFNGKHGVAVISGSGTATFNAIQVNSIHDNGGLGIAIDGDTIIPNDPLDSDGGDNERQNYPVLLTALADPIAGTTTFKGELDSRPNTSYSIEFFSNAECDPSGYGEGHSMFDHILLATDSQGHADFTETILSTSFLVGNVFTLTATDPAGNTSGFSKCTELTVADKGGGGTVTPALPLTFEPFVNPLEIFIGACGANEALITVQIDNAPAPIGYVLLFGRLAEKATFAKSPWMDAVTMAPEGNNRWSYSLSVYDLPEYKTHVDAWLQYQFVVYDAAQQEIGRSGVFGNISVKRCRSLSSAG
jgi:CSLREA domain-containing protein